MAAGFLLFLGLGSAPDASAETPLIVMDEGRRVSAHVRAASLEEVLQAFADATGAEVVTSGPAFETISIEFEHLPAYEALRTILGRRSSVGFYSAHESGAKGTSPRLTRVWVLNGVAASVQRAPKRNSQARSQGSDTVAEDAGSLTPSRGDTPSLAETGEKPILAARPRRSAFEFEPPQPHVVIYTSRGCGSCKRALAYLDSKGISYVHKNITIDPAARKEFRAKIGRGVPLIEVNGESMRGFNAARLDQLLAQGG